MNNKAGKIILITAAIMLPVGILIAAMGLRLGGKSAWGYDLGQMKYIDTGAVSENTMELKEFDSLSVNVSSADVFIKTGDSYGFSYRVEEGRDPEVEQNGSELRIRQPKKISGMIGFGMNMTGDRYEITVPENSREIGLEFSASSGELTIERVPVTGKCKVSSGEVSLSGFDSKGLTIEATSGGISCAGVNADSLYVEASSGEITVRDGAFRELQVKATSGDISISNATADAVISGVSSGTVVMDRLEAKTVNSELTSGDITMDLIGNEADYDFDLSVTSGDISVNGADMGGRYNRDTGSAKKITVDATSGDIEIRLN